MTKDTSSQKQEVTDILEPGKPLSNSRLASLSNLDDEGMQFLRQAWAKTGIERQRKIIASLVHLGKTELKFDFSRIFVFCLTDTDETVRTQAIMGLEAEENPTLITHLLRALEDTSVNVRAAATTALGTFALQGELGEIPSHYTNKVYTALLKILDSKDETIEVRRRALESIAPLNVPHVKDLIKNAYSSNDMKLKASAVYAMGRNCDPAWLANLIVELNSQENEKRYEAATACGELGEGEAVPYLIKLTRDSDIQVQEAAIKALGEIGNEEAKQALDKLGKSTQPRICEAAKAALKELQFCEVPLPSEF